MTAAISSSMPSPTARQSGRGPVDREVLSTRLFGSAAKKSYDPVVDIEWAAPIPAGRYGLSPELSTLYGTPMWDALSDEQRITLTVHEYCSISGVGIWFECLLDAVDPARSLRRGPCAAARPVGADRDPDECRHSVMFARTAEKFGAPSCQPPPSIRRLGKAFAAKGDGPSAYAAILVAEEILDSFQRDLMKDERVQPLTRATSQIHVVEEARHMRFAREEITRRTPELSRWQLRRQRSVIGVVAGIIAENLVQPGVYAAAGLDVGRAVAAANANGYHAAKLRESASGLVGYLRGVGLIGGPSERLWKRANLL